MVMTGAGPLLFPLRVGQLGAADAERFGLQGHVILAIVPDQGQPRLARQLAGLNGTARLRKARRGIAADALAAILAARTLEHEIPRQHDRHLRLVRQLERVRFHLQNIPEPEQEFIAQEIAARFVGDPGNLAGCAAGHEVGRRGVVHAAGLLAQFSKQERAAAGADPFEAVAERVLKQRVQPVERRHGGRGHEQFIGLAVPEHGVGAALEETAVGGFLLEPFPGRGAGFALLPRAGQATWIAGRQAFELHLGVRSQQVGRNLLAVEPERELQGVVDNVLGQVEVRIKDMITGDPARLGTVTGSDALLADGMDGKALEMLGAEPLGRPALDLETDKAHPAGEKSHRGVLQQQ